MRNQMQHRIVNNTELNVTQGKILWEGLIMAEHFFDEGIYERLKKLADKGVTIIDPRQTYVSPEVSLDRVYGGSILFPGARLTGKRTLVGSFAKIGSEGPASINNSIIGPNAEVASGYLDSATLLSNAHAGANCHFRSGTLLEEHAFTGHAVGLKQSILMYSAVTGSLINFCDALISGGRSRKDHSEIGSGFIHFNYTPWGKSGDKATPSLVGNVTEGVFLDQERIFLGGLSGMVGPRNVGFGALTVAGQVIRESVSNATMHSETGIKLDREWSPSKASLSKKRLEATREKNIEYIAQLAALENWYIHVRLKRSRIQKDEELSLVLAGAIETIQSCIKERLLRYNNFAEEWSQPKITLMLSPFEHIESDENYKRDESINSDERINTDERINSDERINTDERIRSLEPLLDWKPELKHDEWVLGLSKEEKLCLHSWISERATKVSDALRTPVGADSLSARPASGEPLHG